MVFWNRSQRLAPELRLEKNVTRPSPVKIQVEGQPISACEGESLASALLAADIVYLRSSPRRREPRGMFCAMGVCQECIVEVDGRAVPACMTPVKVGMAIRLRR